MSTGTRHLTIWMRVPSPIPILVPATIFAFPLMLAMVMAASAQTVEKGDVLTLASRLSTSGDYDAVVKLLEPHIEVDSASADVWLLLAQHRYWSGDNAGARQAYEEALVRYPADGELRAAYARFLLENGRQRAAVELLAPLGSDHAEAEVIRGIAALWSGSLVSAARHFKNALRVEPEHEEAASSLATIREGARSWIRMGAERGTDTQPLTRSGVSAEAGVFVTPLQSLFVEVSHDRHAANETIVPVTRASANTRGFWPALNLETELGAGLAARTDSSVWTARADAGLRLPYGLRLGSRWERAPYLYTVAAVENMVATNGLQASVSLDRGGWIGEAAVGRESFPDDNSKSLAYAWLMAPLLQNHRVTIQAGYAYNYQNTDEHRFTPVLAGAPRPGQPPEWEGRYDPYYTPLNVQTHDLTGSIRLRPANGLTVHANGSYTVVGSEQAPFVYVAGRAPATDLYEHDIHPWNVTGSIAAAVHRDLSIHLEWSHMAKTWYDASVLNLAIYLRL